MILQAIFDTGMGATSGLLHDIHGVAVVLQDICDGLATPEIPHTAAFRQIVFMKIPVVWVLTRLRAWIIPAPGKDNVTSWGTP